MKRCWKRLLSCFSSSSVRYTGTRSGGIRFSLQGGGGRYGWNWRKKEVETGKYSDPKKAIP